MRRNAATDLMAAESPTCEMDLRAACAHGDQHGRKKAGCSRLIGRTKGGMNTKLHAICDSQGRPIDLFVTAGQVSDYVGAWALISRLPDVE